MGKILGTRNSVFSVLNDQLKEIKIQGKIEETGKTNVDRVRQRQKNSVRENHKELQSDFWVYI